MTMFEHLTESEDLVKATTTGAETACPSRIDNSHIGVSCRSIVDVNNFETTEIRLTL